MTRYLNSSDDDFERKFKRLVNERRESDSNVEKDVKNIIADVRARKDEALVELTHRFDKYALGSDGWQIGKDECKKAFDELDAPLKDALQTAHRRITAWHERHLPKNDEFTDDVGVTIGAQWRPVEAAGLYVPGGRAAYPSSLLMNAIPAKVAGVERLVVTTPTPNGEVNPLVMAAAHLAGVDEIWRIGGAQAIAALAWGTQSITHVDVITGPGNSWVAEAKRQVYGTVGIDMVAGPSEIVVVADDKNNPEWIAADLLSQAEHDPTSQSILITNDPNFANSIGDYIAVELASLSTAETARQSWEDYGAVIIVPTLEVAIELVNRLAPEHLELAVDNPKDLLPHIHHAGSVFLGRYTPEAIGDYVAGPNHVLPTGRRARFSSGLSVLHFMKRTSYIALDQDSLAAIGPAAMALADAEGLPAHGLSIAKRLAE